MDYRFLNEAGTHVVRSDRVTIPWNAEAGGPSGGGGVWVQWEEDGSPQPEPFAPPPPTVDDYKNAIQAVLDTKARERRYESGVSLASYTNSTIPEWAAEAAVFSAWRDQVWAYAYTELAKVEGGQRPQPTVAEIVGELPAIDWPA